MKILGMIMMAVCFWLMLYVIAVSLVEINKKLDGSAKIMIVDQDGDIRQVAPYSFP